MDKVIHRLLTHNSEENWIRSGINRPKDKETNRRRNKQTKKQTDEETKRQRNKHTDKQTDKETNQVENRQTKKQTDEKMQKLKTVR